MLKLKNKFLIQKFYKTNFTENQIKTFKFNFSTNEQIENKLDNSNNQIKKDFNKISIFIYSPLIYSTASLLFHLSGYGDFYYFSLKSLAKNVLLINFFNTGILYGIGGELSNLKTMKNFESNVIKSFIAFASCFGMFLYPNPYFFSTNYLIFSICSLSISRSLYPHLKTYSSISFNVLLISFLIIAYILIYNKDELMTEIENESKAEEAVKFLEMSSDKEFIENAQKYEKYLDRYNLNLLISKYNKTI